jgi:4-amino-4-deoxy-L-arabinose transferase-like glycosyltransferase
LVALVAVLGVGAVLRVLLLAALPGFFGPGDPATYFAMASGVLRTGTPRVDFVWNYTTLPATISHVESYYELAFAYLLAGAMALFGARPVVGCGVSLVCGLLAPVLTFAFARRLGTRVGVVAAAIVALEPWSIYYSGVLMKEALVAVVALLSIEGLRRLASVGSRWGAGVGAAAIVLAASAFEYEMLPILACAATLTLALLRRDALLPFLLATGVGVAAALAVSFAALGVPISGKFAFFVGHRLWTTEPHDHGSYASPIGVRRFLPLAYVLGSVLVKWYVPVTVLAWIGSRARSLARIDVVLPCAFAVSFLYFHGVPHDLWERDFIVLLPVLAPLAAVAVCRCELWAEAMGRAGSRLRALSRGMVAAALIAGTAAGMRVAYQFHVAGVFPVRWIPWTLIVGAVATTALLAFAMRRHSIAFSLPAVQRALPALSFGVLLAAYSQSLPWSWIYDNSQFPRYELERATRENACEPLRGLDPNAVVMASDPAEVQLYSGHPTVLLPVTHNAPTIEALRRRYGVRYVFGPVGQLDPRLPPALALRPVWQRLGYALYEFADAGTAAGGPETRARLARAGVTTGTPR